MKIIPPLTVTPNELTSNVPIEETEWTADTYSTGTERYVGTDLYEVVAVPDTADEPVAGAAKEPPTWIKVGKINRYKMFSFVIGEATTVASPLEVKVNFPFLINGVALFDLRATSVQVVVEDPVEGIVYDETQQLADPTGINNWFEYFFRPYALKSDAVFTDLPSFATSDVNVTVINTDGDVKVGEMIVGRIEDIGITLQDFTFGIEDFSRKERDIFGNFTIIERRFAKVASYDVFIQNPDVNAAFNQLARVRAIPTVYIGADDMPETVVLGFYKDFSILRTGPVTSEMTLEIEGLT